MGLFKVSHSLRKRSCDAPSESHMAAPRLRSVGPSNGSEPPGRGQGLGRINSFTRSSPRR